MRRGARILLTLPYIAGCSFCSASAMSSGRAERVKNSFVAGLVGVARLRSSRRDTRTPLCLSDSNRGEQVGDALALGGHYEYDARKIRSNGGFANFSPPGEANNGIGWGTANYHPGKAAGDLTDGA